MNTINKEDESYSIDEMNGRMGYLMYLFAVFLFIPWAANILANAFGFSLDILSYVSIADSKSNLLKEGFHLNLFPVWYIQIPLFAYFTYKRTIDAGLYKWLTPIFMLPIINLVLWFWPSKKQDV